MHKLPEFRKRVSFADTDMAGIVHFSKILCYVEEAEHAALEVVGLRAATKDGGFPKVHVACDYRSPLRFRDEVSVQMTLTDIGESSLKWSFVVSVGDRVSAEGNLVTVYVTSVGKPEGISDDTRTRLQRLLVVED